MCWLIPELTSLRDSTTRRDLYLLALLKFDIVKNSICFYPFGLINFIIFAIKVTLMQI